MHASSNQQKTYELDTGQTTDVAQPKSLCLCVFLLLKSSGWIVLRHAFMSPGIAKLRDGNFGPSPSTPSVLYGMGKAPCIRTCHSVSDSGGFKKPHTAAHSPGTPPGPHNGGEPGGTGRIVLANASSIMLVSRRSLPDGRRHAAPLKSPATTSTCSCSITVRTVSIKSFRYHVS